MGKPTVQGPAGHAKPEGHRARAANGTFAVAGVSFSPRQDRILDLIARGRSQVEIAAELGISISTLRSHLDRMRYKTRTRGTRNALLLFAVRHGYPIEREKE